MMEPDFQQLRPAEFSDRAFLQKALSQHSTPQSCECAEVNLFLWQKSYGEKFMDVQNRFWVIETKTGIPHFPVGKDFPPAELYDLALQAAKAGFKPEFYDAPEAYALQEDVQRYFHAKTNEDSDDYLYDLEQQANLTGAKLRKKRNLVRQFERNYPGAVLQIITGENLLEAVQLAHRLNSKLMQTDFLEEEAEAMEELARYFGILDIGGLLLKLPDGTAAGVSIFSRMADGETFDIHFEKADHSIKGAPQFLTAKVAEHLLKCGGRWMNREQDMGEAGLRQAKRSLDPCGMIRRYVLTARTEVIK